MTIRQEEEVVEAYKKTVPAGERAWFLRVTGQCQEPSRMKTVAAMAGKLSRSEKEPYQLFRILVLLDDDNEHDDNAVSVNVLMKDKSDGVWKPRQIGFLNRTYKRKKVLNQKAVRSFIQKGMAIHDEHKFSSGQAVNAFKARLVYLDYEIQGGDEEIATVIIAFHTNFACASIPRGCAKIENFGYDSDPDIPPVGAHAGDVPVVESNDYPTEKQMDDLISLYRKFESMFSLIEIYKDTEGKLSKSYVVPPLLSQWHGDPIPFETYRALSNYEAEQQEPVYGDVKVAVDLKAIEKEYGPVMAERFYRLDAHYAGPVTRLHVQAVIENLVEALTVFEKFQKIEIASE